MRRVVTFNCDDSGVLESYINVLIELNPGSQLVDVKFSTCCDESNIFFSALVILECGGVK